MGRRGDWRSGRLGEGGRGLRGALNYRLIISGD